MRCLLRGHVKGDEFWYAGTGMVTERCSRCGKFLQNIAVDDWEYGDLLLEFLTQEKTPR